MAMKVEAPPAERGSGMTDNNAKSVKKPSDSVPKVFGPASLLIVDDEHLVATGLAATVTSLGHKVLAIAADGEQAVSLARSNRPDLVLMDIEMPKKSGIDAAREIYEELVIPSVIVSAYSTEEKLRRIQENGDLSGVYGYLLKPINPDELRVSIGVARQRAAVDVFRQGRMDQLERNLAQRRLVEQAKWILVEKHKMTEASAHDKLQKLARDRRKKLEEIAQVVIELGDLPK
jgi:two-component system, response regulator PdtaR